MTTEQRGRVVVITGASAGVGRATAVAFARQGARIGLLARGRAGLEGAKREVEDLGGQALAIPTDVADAAAVERAAEAVEEAFGPIDVWVNNAMASVFSPIEQMRPEEYARVTEVTYLGQVYGALAALKRMRPRDRGKIVFVGSALAYRGIPLQSAYCGAKHAIQGFFDSLRTELLHDGSNVQITMVQMPALNTPQFRWVLSRLPNKAQPVPPIHQPEVAAEAILFAADHDRREMWVGWPTVVAIAGNRVAPWFADEELAKAGYSAQQTDEPQVPDHDVNLWHPVDDERDFGAHGVFDDRATPYTSQLWFSEHHRLVAAGGALLASAALAALGKAAFGSGDPDGHGRRPVSPEARQRLRDFDREMRHLERRRALPRA
ncbi:MAG TPA: SDR family oxidoreductase [Longimicrobiaceae bacterium]|nr:SDR family oxidoreductase [Longimicrobiaceae bacterium]